MEQGGKLYSVGLTIGAGGLAMAAALAALLPINPLAAAQSKSAQSEASALAKPLFSLDCHRAVAQPGFQLVSAADDRPATAPSDTDCAMRRAVW